MLAVLEAWHARMLKNRAVTQLRKRIVAVRCYPASARPKDAHHAPGSPC
jgi:hypothetical protein